MRYIIKIGSNLLTNDEGKLNYSRISNFVRSIISGLDAKHQVIIISSGAVASGFGEMKLKSYPKTILEKQVLASVGQVTLIEAYKKEFSKYSKTIAQILLSRNEFLRKQSYLNIRNVIVELLNKNIIPIINENDVVYTEEIKFGDNDILSALVASRIEADRLIILTDVDGLFTKNPKEDKTSTLIKEIRDLSEIEKIKISGKSSRGSGGMFSKIRVAKITQISGTTLIIANGSKDEVLANLFSDNIYGTKVFPLNFKVPVRKRWLAFGSQTYGDIEVDEGAYKAINKHGKSLLPSGILNCNGNFSSGSSVSISFQKNIFCQGISSYSSKEILKIKGSSSKNIEEKLGYKYSDEVVHRNNMFLIR